MPFVTLALLALLGVLLVVLATMIASDVGRRRRRRQDPWPLVGRGEAAAPEAADPFVRAEQRAARLRQELANGLVNEMERRARQQALRVQDASGGQWQVDAETGWWYRHDGREWVPDEPPGRERLRPVAARSIAGDAPDTGGMLPRLHTEPAGRRIARGLGCLSVVLGGIVVVLVTGLAALFNEASAPILPGWVPPVAALAIWVGGIAGIVLLARRIWRGWRSTTAQFAAVERAMRRLCRDRSRGRVSAEAFEDRLAALQVRDRAGAWWRMDETGTSWYRYEDGRWWPDGPRERPVPPLPRLLGGTIGPDMPGWVFVALWTLVTTVGHAATTAGFFGRLVATGGNVASFMTPTGLLVWGTFSGLLVGIGQWLLLRGHVRRAGWWVLVTPVMLGLGLGFGMIVVEYVFLGLFLVISFLAFLLLPLIYGSMIGLAVGGLQGLVLRRQVQRPGRWIGAQIGAWTLAIIASIATILLMISTTASTAVNDMVLLGAVLGGQLGGAAGLATGLWTGVAMLRLLQHRTESNMPK